MACTFTVPSVGDVTLLYCTHSKLFPSSVFVQLDVRNTQIRKTQIRKQRVKSWRLRKFVAITWTVDQFLDLVPEFLWNFSSFNPSSFNIILNSSYLQEIISILHLSSWRFAQTPSGGEGAHPRVRLPRASATLDQGVDHVWCLVMMADEGAHPWVRVPHASATLDPGVDHW